MKTMKSKLTLKIQIPSQCNSSLQKDKSQSEIDCTHIIDNIYISNYKTSTNYNYLKNNNFSYIINCAGGCQNFTPVIFEEFKYLTINLRDHNESNIQEGTNLIIDFIEKIPKKDINNNKILFHCFEGISRAPALVIAYLIKKKGIMFEKAFGLVKEKRTIVDINIGFLLQLKNMEHIFFNQNSCLFKPLYSLV